MDAIYHAASEPSLIGAVQLRFSFACDKPVTPAQATDRESGSMRVLLAEDENRLGAEIARFLRGSAFAVDIVPNGVDALHLAETESYDALILDIGLPDLDGISLLRELRSKDVNIPVLILTARDRFADKAAGFRAGADDYLTKPFQLEELLLRLQALVRRAAGHAKPAIRFGNLALDTMTGIATLDDVPVRLTALERRVLTYLMMHPGRTISRIELSEHIYEQDQDRDFNNIEVIVSRLRRKFGRERIETSRGEGYRLCESPARTCGH
jgi:two-component system OmpR family response regulator